MGHQDENNYYTLLGINRTADQKQIKGAYRARAKEVHPDLNPHDPEAEENFLKILTAYETLSNPVLKAEYDQTLNTTQSQEPPSSFSNPINQTPLRKGSLMSLFWNIRPSRRYSFDGVDFLIGSFLFFLTYLNISLYSLNLDHPNLYLGLLIFNIAAFILIPVFLEVGILLLQRTSGKNEIRRQLLFMDDNVIILFLFFLIGGLCHLFYFGLTQQYQFQYFIKGYYIGGTAIGYCAYYTSAIIRYLCDRFSFLLLPICLIPSCFFITSILGGAAVIWKIGLDEGAYRQVIMYCFVGGSLISCLLFLTLGSLRPSKNIY